MTSIKQQLLGGSAALALAVGLACPAHAFNEVTWSWTNDVDGRVSINLDIDGKFYLPGIVQVEQMQVNVGSLHALTDQSGTTVINPSKREHHDHDYWGGWKSPALDATANLGRVQGAATAVANVVSISTDTSVQFHDGQYAFGGYDVPDSRGDAARTLAAGFATALVVPTGNRGTDALAAASIASVFGLLTKGHVDATAYANNVKNASVDISATAAGNVHSVTLNPPGLAGVDGVNNGVVVGDLTQYNYNDVSATAKAKNLQISGYKNLGELTSPVLAQNGSVFGSVPAAISNVSATAVGNVSTITNRISPVPSGNH